MIRSRLNQRRGAVALVAAGGLLTSAGLAGLARYRATASSHREAPLVAGLPQYDNTDLYAFRSPERQNTVTLAANWIPFEEPAGGPNFYSFATDARYDIHVDNDADAKADVTFRWTFKDHYRSKNTFLYANGPVTSLKDKNLNYYQTYRLVRIKGQEHQGPGQEQEGRAVATSVTRRCPTTPSCATRRSRSTASRPVLRRSGRGLVLPRPARLRPALRR